MAKLGPYHLVSKDGLVIEEFKSMAKLANHYGLTLTRLRRIIGETTSITPSMDTRIISESWKLFDCTERAQNRKKIR